MRSGEQYSKSGKYQEAVIEFRNAIQIDPRFAEAHYELARAYLGLNQSESAFSELTEAVALEPANADAQLRLAGLLISRRRYAEAQAIAQKILRRDPGNAEAHAVMAEKYTLTGDAGDAIAELRQTIALEPRRVEAYGALGAVYRQQERLPEAEAAYQQGVTANPHSVAAHMALGQYYFSEGRMAEAESEARKGWSLDPHAVPPGLMLARIYVLTGRLADAESLYKQLKKTAPSDPRAWHALGTFYASMGEKEKAVEEFHSLLSVRPEDDSVRAGLMELLIDLDRTEEARSILRGANQNDPGILVAAARIFIAERKFDLAESSLEKAVKSDPSSARGYYFLGITQKSLGLPALARSSFTHALELSPGMPQAVAALAALNVRAGQDDEALRLAGNALRSNPKSSDAHVTRARALMAQGRIPEAQAALRDALTNDPVSLPALAEWTSLSAKQGDAGAAVQRLSELVRIHPQNPGLHFLLAVAYYSRKDLQNAERSVKQATALDPHIPGAFTLLANIEFAKGSFEQATADLRQAITDHPRTISNYMALVTAYEKAGNWPEAKKWCEKAHQVDPDAPLVGAELAFLYLEHGGDVNVALSLAQAAKRKLPDSAITSDALGWAYYKMGSAEPAVAQFHDAVLKFPNNPIYQYHLGMAYVAARKLDLARQALQNAIRQDPKFPFAADAEGALARLLPDHAANAPIR